MLRKKEIKKKVFFADVMCTHKKIKGKHFQNKTNTYKRRKYYFL